MPLNGIQSTIEWHPVNNRDLTPAQVFPGGDKKVWWLCGNGHEWLAWIYSRTAGVGCPYCDLRPRSKVEIRLAYELASVIDFNLDQHKVIGVRNDSKSILLDCDIVIEQLHLIVEYDGSYWHHDQEVRDREKTACLARAGYWCIRIREYPLAPICPPDQGTDIVVRSTDPVHMIATEVLKQAALRFPAYASNFQYYEALGAPQAEVVAAAAIRRISK